MYTYVLHVHVQLHDVHVHVQLHIVHVYMSTHVHLPCALHVYVQGVGVAVVGVAMNNPPHPQHTDLSPAICQRETGT